MARSLSNEEIALIKAMLNRGLKNNQIQFYFNHPNRPVNAGRISEVRSGHSGVDIEEASQAELDAFYQDFERRHQSSAPATLTLAEQALSKFETKADGNWYLIDGKTSDQECKETFDVKRLNPLLKAIAGMANNKGGYIFIGVNNNHQVVGLNDNSFQEMDIVQLSDKAKNLLCPTPDFIKDVMQCGGLTVGFIYVHKFSSPPIIVCRDGDGLEDGSILFRYPGQTAQIKFGDLHEILRQRDRSAQEKLLHVANRVSEIGTDDALLINAKAGTLETGNVKYEIDGHLAKQLEFIKEGEFTEVEGAPTLRLVGDVKAISAGGEVLHRIEEKAMSAAHVLEAFLSRKKINNPFEYIRVSGMVQRQWLPLFYFARLDGFSNIQMAERLHLEELPQRHNRDLAVLRLRGQRSARRNVSGKAADALQAIINGGNTEILQQHSDLNVLRAISAIDADVADLNELMRIVHNIHDKTLQRDQIIGDIYRAAARLDELLYRVEA